MKNQAMKAAIWIAHACIQARMHIHKGTNTLAHNARAHRHMHTLAHTDTHLYKLAHAHRYTHTLAHTQTHTCTHCTRAQTHAHTQTCTHMHTSAGMT